VQVVRLYGAELRCTGLHVSAGGKFFTQLTMTGAVTIMLNQLDQNCMQLCSKLAVLL
jgi:hypothetical protein